MKKCKKCKSKEIRDLGHAFMCLECESDFPKKEKKPKAPKIQKSESELVHEYAEKVIRGKQSRGHVDKRFGYTESSVAVNKELWLDTDFFCSLVFQSKEQKYEFLNKLCEKFGTKPEYDSDTQIQIINGLKFAEQLGITLKKDEARPYPYGNLDLRPYVMDNESI